MHDSVDTQTSKSRDLYIVLEPYCSRRIVTRPHFSQPSSHLLPLFKLCLIAGELPDRPSQHSWVYAAISPHLVFLVLDIRRRSFRSYGFLVSADEEVVVLTVQTVDVFEGAISGFRVEEVDDR